MSIMSSSSRGTSVLSLLVVGLLVVGCQTASGGWTTNHRAVAIPEAAALYAVAADEWRLAIDEAFAIYGAEGTGSPAPTAVYYAAGADAAWRLAVRVAQIETDEDVRPALVALVRLAAGESAALRRASRSDDPAAALLAIGVSDADEHRELVDRLRAQLGLPASAIDIARPY